MPTGYLSTGKTIVLSIYPQPEGLDGYFKRNPATSSPAGFHKTPIRQRIWAIKCSCSSIAPIKPPLPKLICLFTPQSCAAYAAFLNLAGKIGSPINP